MELKELEIGMYVKTKDGRIEKIKVLEEWTNDLIIIEVLGDSDFDKTLYLPDVVKYSHNIINLIEIGDYVNGMKIEQISDEELITNQVYMETDVDYDYEDNIITNDYEQPIIINSYDIKEILTKEQYENNVYKIEV